MVYVSPKVAAAGLGGGERAMADAAGAIARCAWAGNDPLMIAYHDYEWGKPVHNDQKLFEFLVLEGAQAGLSWSTILKKREGYRRLFHRFDIEKVAQMTEADQALLLQDSSIVRNRLKVASAINNANVMLKIQQEHGSLDHYFWSYVNHQPIRNHFLCADDLPAQTELSKTISKDLKKRGCNFVGPTIIYAFMQATGMVNDHTVNCYLSSV